MTVVVGSSQVVVSTLPESGFELNGFAFGTGTSIFIEDVVFSEPTVIVGGGSGSTDVFRPRADGVAFGREYRGGRLVTFSLLILTDYGNDPAAIAAGYGTGLALDVLAALEAAWLADGVRTTPAAVSTLRYRLAGRQRVVYGRGRKFAAIIGQATSAGKIPVTATFQCIDHLIYDDVSYTNLVPFVGRPAGGLVYPVVFPWSTLTIAYSPGTIAVTGNAPAWLVMVINGPIVNPTVRLVGGWTITMNLTLLVGQYVVIDPRPWSRGVRLNGTTNVAGSLSPTSPRLSALTLPPGRSTVVLGGTDITGTASLVTSWRGSHTSP